MGNTPTCQFFCPLCIHDGFQSVKCLLPKSHDSSILYFDHDFACSSSHNVTFTPEIQVCFLCKNTIPNHQIIKKSTKILKKFIKDKKILIPEFCLTYYDNYKFKKPSFLNQIIYSKPEEITSTKISSFYDGILKVLDLEWSGRAIKILLIYPQKNDLSMPEEKSCSSEENLNYEDIFKKIKENRINVFLLGSEKYFEQKIQNFKENLYNLFHSFEIEDDSLKNILEFLNKTLEQKKQQINKKIIWFDKKIYSAENKNLLAYYLNEFDVTCFDNYQKAGDWIKNSNYEEYLVITSGSDGENFSNLIHNNSNILAILVYCFNVKIHKIWAKKFDKIHIVTSNFNEIYKELLKLYNSYCAY